MKLSKREFLIGAGALASVGAVASVQAPAAASSVGDLKSMTAGAVPISIAERQERINKAARLMRQRGMSALIVEVGSALTYFTGIRWWRSERFTGIVIRDDASWCVVTPFFEGPSIREQMTFGEDVRTWHEDENPFAVIVDFIGQQEDGQVVGVEETARYFLVDGVKQIAPALALQSGADITRGCRMFKSPAELALMQLANDVTLAAYTDIYPKVVPGMTPSQVGAMMNDATKALGGTPEFSLVLLGAASAYPHGTDQPQRVREGDIVLMDCGCNVQGYQSDISRTWVMGKANRAQRRVWQTVRDGQQLALDTMQPGVPAGRIDQVVRAFYETKGYGPGYQAPGLTHRLGHGIGLDGHEPVNFVGNEQTPLAPGMCFSNEPGIYLPGQFGVRLEDCLTMTADGPSLFTELSPSIDKPFG